MGVLGRRSVICVIALVVVVLAGCSSDPSSDGSASPPSPSPTSSSAPPATTTGPGPYVALGDSFTAGPGIDPQQTDAGFCQRSAENWPTLLATALGRDVTDVSCSGATTADLMTTLGSGAVPSDAGLVTVGAGGNDGGLFLSLIRACTIGTGECAAFVDGQAPPILQQTTTDLAALLESARKAAPNADILLVGYPRIMPSAGTCDTVGIPATDVATVVSAEEALDTALAAAADRAGVDYASLRAASEGHDACAGDEAWTNGVAPTAGDGIVFHPNRRGMAAIAPLVAAEVQS